MSHVPAGFHTVTPYLSVPDADGFLDFLQAAFGAVVRGAHREDGAVRHAEVVIEGSVLELSEARPAWPARPVMLHVFVADPDAAFERAIAAGATVTYPVTDNPYGERSGGVRDRWGNDWFLAAVTDPVARSL